jgi:Uma2 family endonuclease
MASAARKFATYEDVLAAPENQVAQVVDGDLVLQPRPARRHTRVASRIGGSLDGPFDRGVGGPGGWIILDEPELHLGGDLGHILVPDLAGWRRARVPHFDDGPYFDVAPDWVCEVLSPATASLDRGRKADIYASAGIGHLWLFDTDGCQVEAFENVDGRWLRLGAYTGSAERISPFDAVPIDIPMLMEGFRRPA